jgi:hypothetical protein
MLKSVLFKIYSKKYILKIYSNMFRITQDPVSGSGKLYSTEITFNGSIVLVVMCIVGVWRQNLNLWCACMLHRVER